VDFSLNVGYALIRANRFSIIPFVNTGWAYYSIGTISDSGLSMIAENFFIFGPGLRTNFKPFRNNPVFQFDIGYNIPINRNHSQIGGKGTIFYARLALILWGLDWGS
jgi:hypothetical protein